MSDGNYNRNLLPYNNYRSGLKAGHAQMKTLALEAFVKWFREYSHESTDEEVTEAQHRFHELLTQ